MESIYSESNISRFCTIHVTEIHKSMQHCSREDDRRGTRVCDDNDHDDDLLTVTTNRHTVHPPGDMSMDNHGGMMSTSESLDSSATVLCKSYQ
jgi:hypothetical protein